MKGWARERRDTPGRRLLAVAGAVLLAIAPLPSRAQDADWLRRVDEAAACYARFDYDCVMDRLSGFSVPEAAAETPRPVVEAAVRLLTVAYVVRGVPERARFVLEQAVAQWADYRLEGDDLGPQYQALFAGAQASVWAAAVAHDRTAVAQGTARRSADRDAAQACAEAVATWARALASTSPVSPREPSAPPALRLEAGPAYELFGGQDASTFDNGIGLTVRAATERPWGWVLELGASWRQHAVVLTDLVEAVPVDLGVLDLGAALLVPVQWSWFRVLAGVGAGYSAFGFEDVFERGGPLFELPVRLEARFLGRGRIAFDLRPRLVLVQGEDGLVTSTPLLMALTLGVDLL